MTGRVQGVSYRAWFSAAARQAGLAGWLRNRRDGSVEAVIEGPSAAVDAMVARAHDGPPLAHVTAVRLSEDVDASPLQGFATHPTI